MKLVAGCTLALLVGCTGQIGLVDTGTAGAGSGQGGAVGAGGSGAPSGTGGAVVSGTGGSTSTGTGGVGPLFPNPPAFQPPVGMLRRLTRAQFRNAVRDVFGVEVNIADLDADSWNGNFAVIGAMTVGLVRARRGAVLKQRSKPRSTPCLRTPPSARSSSAARPTGTTTDSCLRGFLQTLGLRAWRRPLVAAELDRLMSVAVKASTELGARHRGRALGDGGALHLAELPLSPRARRNDRERRRCA